MFRDYLLQVGLSLEVWCAISNFPCNDLCEIPWFQVPPIPFPSHSPFISFLWPPLKHHDQLIHVPIDFNTPGSRLLAAFNSQLPFYHVLSIEEKSVE